MHVMCPVDCQVTTKKGYDGCRKAEYLYAHQPITDKTFATLGETTISNLKATFEGVETGEQLREHTYCVLLLCTSATVIAHVRFCDRCMSAAVAYYRAAGMWRSWWQHCCICCRVV